MPRINRPFSQDDCGTLSAQGSEGFTMGPCHSAQVPAISVSIPTFFSPPPPLKILSKYPDKWETITHSTENSKALYKLALEPSYRVPWFGTLVWNSGLEPLSSSFGLSRRNKKKQRIVEEVHAFRGSGGGGA